MVSLTRLDGRALVVNADHILTVERTPDTMLTLTSGTHLLVREKVAEVVALVAAWRREIAREPRVVENPPEPPQASGRVALEPADVAAAPAPLALGVT